MKNNYLGCICFALAGLLVSCTTAKPTGMRAENLTFNPNAYTTGSITVDGKAVNYRAYEGITYVANPVETTHTAWQQMNIYVPESAYNDQSAPIFFKNEIGGYMPADPAQISAASRDGSPSAIQRALAKGYVVVSPGARGRTSQEVYNPGDNPFAPAKEASGDYIGKAPAAIVDLKAAVRYLRYNDAVMPGDAEKIISDGTSAGGAMSALLGASGNNPLYETYLKEIGAADTRDDIFAVISFCPITDLEHADMSYEWLYSTMNDIRKKNTGGGFPGGGAGAFGSPDARMPGNPVNQSTLPVLRDDEKALSAELAALFPEYLGSLGLVKADGAVLTAADALNGVYLNYIKEFVIVSAQEAFNKASDKNSFKSTYSWLVFDSTGTVIKDINFPVYLAYVMDKQPLKPVPAFDSLGVLGGASSGENDTFGTAAINGNNFTGFSWYKNAANQGTFPDEIKERAYLMNAMNFIGAQNTDTAQNWYIRHGTIDRDTAFTVSVNLYTKLLNKGYDVNYKLAWERPHSGDYNLDEVFAWIAGIK
ncbi:alpha/beta hydrolase [Spirochaetia bacterium]|nr:alpha/beta hydrolase [Spirochaetia bacterium]